MGADELMEELAARVERGDGFIMQLTVDPQGDKVSAEFMPIEPKPAFAKVVSTFESVRDQVSPVWAMLQSGVQTLLASANIERRA